VLVPAKLRPPRRLIVQCPGDLAYEVTRLVEEVMVAGMDEVVNPNLSPDHPEQVPEEVDIAILKCRAGDLYENGEQFTPSPRCQLNPYRAEPRSLPATMLERRTLHPSG
jgi:hypothetical protein